MKEAVDESLRLVSPASLTITLLMVIGVTASGQQPANPFVFIPDTVSDEARSFLKTLSGPDQAIDQAGGTAKHLYDGMPHVFQPRLADAPEGKAALRKMAAFLKQHLAN